MKPLHSIKFQAAGQFVDSKVMHPKRQRSNLDPLKRTFFWRLLNSSWFSSVCDSDGGLVIGPMRTWNRTSENRFFFALNAKVFNNHKARLNQAHWFRQPASSSQSLWRAISLHRKSGWLPKQTNRFDWRTLPSLRSKTWIQILDSALTIRPIDAHLNAFERSGVHWKLFHSVGLSQFHSNCLNSNRHQKGALA